MVGVPPFNELLNVVQGAEYFYESEKCFQKAEKLFQKAFVECTVGCKG